ncbi:MAG TPA: outer membrane beta-barrel protein [Hyphomicrobiaceae bacterium]|nr:outer membrane beta-barrel protein [Hyphomicrobiaceae bacterium]
MSSHEPAAGPNWNGFSVGLGVGATSAVTDVSAYNGYVGLDGVGGEGVIGTISLGYDRVLRPGWVAGLFTDYTIGGAETDANFGDIGASFDQNYSWAIGARLGFLTNPSTLVYGTAGYTQSEFEVSFLGGSADQTFGGYFVGAGIETYLRPNWTAKLEYRFSQYDGEDFNTGGFLDVEPSTHAVRAVLSYKFGGPRD